MNAQVTHTPAIRITGDAPVTPQMIAEMWWELDSAEQAEFFAHLYRIAGWKLSMQMLYVAYRIADMDGIDGVMGLSSFADEGKSYVTTAIEYRGKNAKKAIADLVRDAIAKAQP